MNQNWTIAPPIPANIREELVKFPPILQQLLYNRGYVNDATARDYLKASVSFDTSPFLLKGMDQAIDRILLARGRNEKVAIYGDYDVDGVTSTTLLVQAFAALGIDVREYIPNRFDEGYGLNNEALLYLKGEEIGLVVSVDCGIRSTKEADYAREIGLDLIITDHHEPGEVLPSGFAVINPKQPGDDYAEKFLAGVGIAYKLVCAMAEKIFQLEGKVDLDPAEMLDLVAMGTVADVAPLTGENRQLVRRGLRKLRTTKRQGIAALAAVADIKLPKANAMSIGFGLAPRLNASGRLESALLSFQLLSTDDISLAGELAQRLNVQNYERQKLTREIQERAREIATQDDPTPQFLFAVAADFNHGIVGLAASKLCENFYRPAIVGGVDLDEGTTRCSCRSIPEYHMSNALDRISHLFIKYGGHAAAAGFTIKNENIAEFKELMAKDIAEKIPSDLAPTLKADMEVKLSDLSFETMDHLEYLQPTGQENPDAVFVCRGVEVRSKRTVGSDKHLKLTLAEGKSTIDAIGFNLGHLLPSLPKKIDVMFNLDLNEYNGQTTLQLRLKDIKY